MRILGIVGIAIFYASYFWKLLQQKRRGIQTNQLGKGNKAKKTVMIEMLLRYSSVLVVGAMLISVLWNTSMMPNVVVRSIGIIIFYIGIGFFIIAMYTMKDSWRAGIPSEDQTQMITSGIYRVSRNPAFLGFDLTYIGISVAFGNSPLIVLSVITIILMHLQILEEEKYLEFAFGDSYIQYKNKAGRYFVFF